MVVIADIIKDWIVGVTDIHPGSEKLNQICQSIHNAPHSGRSIQTHFTGWQVMAVGSELRLQRRNMENSPQYLPKRTSFGAQVNGQMKELIFVHPPYISLNFHNDAIPSATLSESAHLGSFAVDLVLPPELLAANKSQINLEVRQVKPGDRFSHSHEGSSIPVKVLLQNMQISQHQRGRVLVIAPVPDGPPPAPSTPAHGNKVPPAATGSKVLAILAPPKVVRAVSGRNAVRIKVEEHLMD